MAHEDIDITGHYLMIDGTRTYYEECGEGIPLVCIHSAGSCTLLYFDFLRDAAIKKYGYVPWEDGKERRYDDRPSDHRFPHKTDEKTAAEYPLEASSE